MYSSGPSPPPPVDPIVIGYIEDVSSTNLISGWACDKGIAKSIDVHVYVGGAYGQTGATYAAYGKADVAIGDTAQVRAACGVSSGGYRFFVTIPKNIRDANVGKKIYVHGISTSSSRENLAIGNSGMFGVK